MKEIICHPAYSLINKLNDKGDGNNIIVDYVILQNDMLHCGIEEHRQAAIDAMQIIADRYKAKFTIEESKMLGVPYSVDDFFEDRIEAPYEHAFLDPPYGSELEKADFFHVNNILFSHIKNLEIYDWCSGIDWTTPEAYWEHKWSNYFDYGLEWWGVIFWTVYDKMTDIFVVIAASSTN
ncbi:hypothetical protein [Clostridium botulinum]|uniref:hypothetical protein n=1 Tax=Clostridium botulinum TaxID=1491 RepID=UPI0008FC64AE|nr:hypothetical protein [Clostridium botulinum]APC80356.1 hypothetical protein NPD2_857 [Clostridium botulinum]APU61332.1 hypothetical protein NPD8_3291 [Clostridium botulinum]MCS4457852.1 hypothetical protein [Clostridium botulinum]MCS4519244.1 hypothetical protein [Clostridium botulinum]